ncbi:uncharacterized protein LOC128831526 isoform X2 [Malaclemys terrapin pileata]|uniref:uncharacterized protein LOC128831526 isoform X2 n=1 Tax=Malaclemys terrapin pileata TaxID=2991368 RepID=UPI0023A8BEFF|nr:uncharacterized protein LOC128831526 isoform X2 [Malaclemys terrapin pileata]
MEVAQGATVREGPRTGQEPGKAALGLPLQEAEEPGAQPLGPAGATPCLATGETPACPEQEMGDPGSSTSSSEGPAAAPQWSVRALRLKTPPLQESSLSFSGGGGRGGGGCAPRRSCHQGHPETSAGQRRVLVDAGQGQAAPLPARYPHSVLLRTKAGEDTLELHCSKVALVESIEELIEDLPLESESSSILSSSMATVCNLSSTKPREQGLQAAPAPGTEK